MKAARCFLLILLAVLFGLSSAGGQTGNGSSSPQPTTGGVSNAKKDNEDERYRIGYQDTLEVQVYDVPKLSQKVTVNPDGTINLFRATKPITAVCKTERELARDIEAEYLRILRKPEVIVFAVEKKSQSYGVIGSVEKAGTYYISRRIRLLDLLSYAGGPNREAGNRLIVARTGSSSACQVESDDSVISNDTILINLKVKDVMEGKQNPWMQPGDIISVLDADEVYVYGNVNKVGSIKMKEPITLTQAIVSAEGLKGTAKSKVRVLRQKEGSSDRDELVYDLKEIEKRKINDPFLEPNDIVAVSEDSTKVVLQSITGILKNGVPSLFYRIP